MKNFNAISAAKFLVCVGASRLTAKCIRWTAKTANASQVPWVAVYVESMDSQNLTDDQKNLIKTNLSLAEELGAEIVTLNGDDIAESIAAYAELAGVTGIVVGKSRQNKISALFRSPLEDKLLSLLQDVDIHVIMDSPNRKKHKAPLKKWLTNTISLSLADTFKTFGFIIAATLICFALRALAIDQHVIMVYILCVLVISRSTRGYFYGVVSAVLSVLIFNFFFVYPYFTFNFILPGYPMTFIVMLLVALVTSAMTTRIKTTARVALEREQRTEVLYELNKQLLVTRGTENIAALTIDYISKLYGRSGIFYPGDPGADTVGAFRQAGAVPDAALIQSSGERAIAQLAFKNMKSAGAGTETYSGSGVFYLPVATQGKALGVIGISCLDGNLDENQRFFLQTIASQVALALERQLLSDEQRSLLIDSEKEKMRSLLLSAISHDLRTPLTSIRGSCSALLDSEDSINAKSRKKLLTNIQEETLWLIRMVENILSVTWMKDGSATVTKTPEVAEEIVAEAVSRVKDRYPGRKLNVKVPEEMLIVPMDGTLIEQVIINLIENAYKHTGNDVSVDIIVGTTENSAVFEVLDDGEGLPEEELAVIFDNYPAGRKLAYDSERGIGIGLSICKTIVTAHSGTIEAYNRPEGGAAFRFTLPLDEVLYGK